jgi:hypothetical protein
VGSGTQARIHQAVAAGVRNVLIAKLVEVIGQNVLLKIDAAGVQKREVGNIQVGMEAAGDAPARDSPGIGRDFSTQRGIFVGKDEVYDLID